MVSVLVNNNIPGIYNIESPKFPLFPIGVDLRVLEKHSHDPPAHSFRILSRVNDPFLKLRDTREFGVKQNWWPWLFRWNFLPLNAANTTLFLSSDAVINEVNLHYIISSQNTISHSQEKASNQTRFLYTRPWRRRLSRKEKHSNIILKIQEGQCRSAENSVYNDSLLSFSNTEVKKVTGTESQVFSLFFKLWIMTQYQLCQTL